MAYIDGFLILVRRDCKEDDLAHARTAVPNLASTGERA